MSLEALNGPGRNAASVTKAVAEISGFYKDVCAVFTDLGGKALQVTVERTVEAIFDGLLLSWSH